MTVDLRLATPFPRPFARALLLLPVLLPALALLALASPGGVEAQAPRVPNAAADTTTGPPATARAARIVGTVRVRPEDGGAALPSAMVTVRDGTGSIRTVLTDGGGAYRVEGVPPGTVRVRAIHVGYEDSGLELVVPAGGTVELDMELSRRPLELRGIVVYGDRGVPMPAGDEADAADVVRSGVRLRLLEISPGLVEAGIGQGEGPRPPPSDPGNVLLMRGSTADLNLVLLDGAAVYAPFHLGGLLPGFEPDLFARAEHHTGGAPARYDGGLSYILDLRTRAARRDAVHVDAAVDALSARATVEAPLGDRAGVLFSGRALHNVVGPTLFGGVGSPYGYRDGLLRLDATLGRSAFGLTAFSNRESVYLDLTDRTGPEDEDALQIGAGEEGDASWGNEALAGFWRVAAGDFDVELGGAISRYQAGLPTRSPVQPTQEGAELDTLTVVASGQTDRTRFTIDATRSSGDGALRLGLTYDRMEVAYRTRPSETFGSPDGLGASGTVVGGYLEGTRPLADAVDLEYGVRLDRFRPGGLRAAPRLTLLWTLGPTARLTLTGGRYHQLTRRADVDAELGTTAGAENGTGTPATLSEDAGPLLQVATSDHLVASLEQALGETVHLTTELFLKDFRDVPGIASRRFSSSGVDLQILHRKEARTVWLGYSLAWFWEPEEERGGFSGRHLLTAGLNTPLVGPTGASFRVSFSDGLPLTSIRFDGATPGATRPAGMTTDGLSQSAAPDPAERPADGFLRLDAEIFADWSTRRAGRDVRFRPYLRVLNALDRRDALFHYFEPWREESLRPLVGVPLLPVLGLEVRF